MSCKVCLQLFFTASEGKAKVEHLNLHAPLAHTYIYHVYSVIHYFWWLNFRCGANFRAPPSMSRDKNTPRNKTKIKIRKIETKKTNKLGSKARKVGWYAWLSTDISPPLSGFYSLFFAPHQAQPYTVAPSLFGDKSEAEKIMINMLASISEEFCRRVCHLMTFPLNAKWTSPEQMESMGCYIVLLPVPRALLCRNRCQLPR